MIGPLAAWLALLAAGSVQAALPAPSSVSLRGWTKDGKSTAYESIIDGKYGSGAQNYYRFLIVTDSDGSPQRRYQMDKRLEEGTAVPEGEAAWTSAEPAEQGERWQEENALVSAPGSHMILPGETVALPAPWEGASAHVEISRDRCPLARLIVALGGQSKAFADSCPAPRKGIQLFFQAALSPDGKRAALAINVTRLDDQPSSEAPAIDRGYFTVESRRSFASVDLLDAGVGPAADSLAEKLKQAGFQIGHRGKAVSRRDATAVYFTAGFEAEARAIADLLHAEAKSVQPLTWKSPFAITVAAGPAKSGD